MDRDERVSRITLPTASFSLTNQQIRWIAEEAERRRVKKSVLMREVLDRAMSGADEESGEYTGAESDLIAVAS